VGTKTTTHTIKRDEYTIGREIAHNTVEDWVARQYIPTVKEFAPYTGRDFKNFMTSIAFRSVYVKNISWTIITRELVQDFVYVCRKLRVGTLLDVGCGHGVLAHVLREKGLAVDAINANKDGYHDIQRPWGKIIKGDAMDFIKENASKYHGVILSWPPYDEPFGTHIVKAMNSGQILFYCGEGGGGCTGDKYLHGALGDWYDWSDEKAPTPPVEFNFLEEETERLNKHMLQFDGIHDRWRVYIKK
jgi:hypothetical protein